MNPTLILLFHGGPVGLLGIYLEIQGESFIGFTGCPNVLPCGSYLIFCILSYLNYRGWCSDPCIPIWIIILVSYGLYWELLSFAL